MTIDTIPVSGNWYRAVLGVTMDNRNITNYGIVGGTIPHSEDFKNLPIVSSKFRNWKGLVI